MELEALKKAKKQREEQSKAVKKEPKAKPIRKAASASRAGEGQRSNTVEKPVSEVIQIYYNTLHYNTIQNAITAQHNAGDFTYTSISDLIRSALEAYQNGMQLTELDEKGEKKLLPIRVDSGLKAFFDSLPDRMKSTITERAVRTFIKNQFR